MLIEKLFTVASIFVCTSFSERELSNKLKHLLSRNHSKVLFELQSVETSDNPYCYLCCISINQKSTSKLCGSHTLCKYRSHQTGPACKGYIEIEFSKEERDVILDIHNTLRNFVASGKELRGNPGPQPSASNMRAISWNDELALIASRWAAQCIYANDKCRDTEEYPVGQNIAHGNFATNNDLSFIEDWYNEVQYLNKSYVKDFKLLQHSKKSYSQLVWADTYEIGCARAVFQVSRGPRVFYREHFICNYGPIGNIPNQPMYQIGSPCTTCHEGTHCLVEYPALCGGDAQVKELTITNDKIRSFKQTELSMGSMVVESSSNIPENILQYYFYFIYLIIYFLNK